MDNPYFIQTNNYPFDKAIDIVGRKVNFNLFEIVRQESHYQGKIVRQDIINKSN